MMREFGEPAAAEKPSGCLKYFLYAGCTAFALIGAGIFILPSFLLVSLFWDPEPDPGWEKTLLPEKIHVSKVLLSQHQRGGILENCVFVAYELTPNAARAMKTQGGNFFKSIGQPPEQKRNFYGPWKSTPLPQQPYIFATGAMGGCNGDGSVHRLLGRTDFQNEEGNFYATTENLEGIIILSPKRQLIIHAYFG